MRIEKREGSKERRVVTGMIVDRAVLAEIADKWTRKEPPFASQWANTIGQMCVDFYRKYEDAPKKAIESMYEAWADSCADKDSVKLVGRLLEEISGEWDRLGKESNSKVTIDQAAKLFNRVRLARLKDKIEGLIDLDDVDKATSLVESFNRLEMGEGAGIDLFTDEKAILETFNQVDQAALVEYPGALGKFFGKTFSRGTFVAFMGPEKRGKSFWLLDVGYRALLQRRKVAHFECGDLTEQQIKERYITRAAGHPMDSETGWPLTIEYPKSIEPPEEMGRKPLVLPSPRTFKGPLSPDAARKAAQSLMVEKVKSKNSYFKLFCYPNNTLTVEAADAKLRQVERATGWVPDVVIFDYADILAPAPGFTESRDAVNANWKRLRTISMQRNCCVVTASQTNAASYQSDVIEKWNFSEDKRKLAHVSSMIGLNQSKDEEEAETMRLNFVARRKGKYQTKKMVYVAMCLALANPAVRSCT